MNSEERGLMGATPEEIRQQIRLLVEQYHLAHNPARDFDPERDFVPVTGKVFDADDISTLVDSALDFWLTSGRYAREFETTFARMMGVRHATLVNSGSSANLLAIALLCDRELGERRLRPGDEVITVAAGFPTTVSPLAQYGLVPVFVDVQLPTYNIDPSHLTAALSGRTRAIILAHTLGNPFDVERVRSFARQHDLFLVEDTCDAVGATFGGEPVGSFGDVATVSFYPAHHLTMGEGGAVLTNSPKFRRIVESLRDWGRDCWCEPGTDDTCGKRFDWKLGDLPIGYDHKYTYSRLGYNLKVTDMQAAVGVAQLRKLEGFIAQRRANFSHLRERLAPLEDRLVLPEATPDSVPSWFGFPLTIREDCGIDRRDVVASLETQRIATRLLFGGNLLRQPAFQHIKNRIIGELPVTEQILHRSFWIGVYPGLTAAHLDYVAEVLIRSCGGR